MTTPCIPLQMGTRIAVTMMSFVAVLASWFAAQGAIPGGLLVFGGFAGEFFANGSYRIEGDGWPALIGTFTLTDSEFVMLPSEGASECTGPGRYRVSS